ncbi:sulfotransferase domain-containing protein [Elusimicrobiota bacterium]
MNNYDSNGINQINDQEENVLVHIGYHKTGTSWLQQFLFNEEWGIAKAVPRPMIKENLIHLNALDYNADKCRQKLIPHIHEAKKKKLISVISEERLSGNPHSGGYDSKEIADRLFDAFPGAKILIIIREQNNMIRSAYKQYVKGVGSYSLKKYLAPSSQKKLPTFDFSHFKYHRLIKYYIDLFGKDNVLVLPYESFKEDPAGFIERIVHFAGSRGFDVKALADKKNEKVNISMSSFTAAYKRCLNPLIIEDMGSVFFLSRRIGRLLKRLMFIIDGFIPVFIKNAHEKKCRDIIKSAVGSKYQESNRITSEMINTDLRKYGYDT